MPFVKTEPRDVTVHWSEEAAPLSVCGLTVGFTFKGAAVTQIKMNDTLRSCGRCIRSLEREQREIMEALERFSEVGL